MASPLDPAERSRAQSERREGMMRDAIQLVCACQRSLYLISSWRKRLCYASHNLTYPVIAASRRWVMAGQRATTRRFTRSVPGRLVVWTMAVAAATAFGAARVATNQSTASQERRSDRPPPDGQERPAARSALRPAVMGATGAVSAGHPLTTAAGFEILLAGGNAFDAGVATLLAGGVLEQDLYSLGGEALVLVYPKSEGKVTAVVGQGWAPKAVSVEWYRSRKKTLDGEGLDPAVVPGALHAALTVLEKWGTMSFEQVSARAIAYAEHGFPIRQSTVTGIQRQ